MSIQFEKVYYDQDIYLLTILNEEDGKFEPIKTYIDPDRCKQKVNELKEKRPGIKTYIFNVEYENFYEQEISK